MVKRNCIVLLVVAALAALVCSGSAMAFTWGPSPITGTGAIGNVMHITFIDFNDPLAQSGTLTQWNFMRTAYYSPIVSETFKLQVFRPVVPGDYGLTDYQLVGETVLNVLDTVEGLNSVSDSIPVQAGDLLGVRFLADPNLNVPVANGSGPLWQYYFNWNNPAMDIPVGGKLVTVPGAAWNPRDAIQINAEVTSVPEPASICVLGLGLLGLIRRRK